MNNNNFFLFLGFFLLIIGGAEAQEVSSDRGYSLKGKLIDEETSEVIPFAHITNINLKLRSSSDSSGFFTITAREGDSLLITNVTYGKLVVMAPVEPSGGNRLLFRLSPNVYELEEVVINRFPSEYLLKQQLLGLQLPEEKGPDLHIPEGYREQSTPSENASFNLGSPVSAIASQFSKKERGRAFAAELKAKEARMAEIKRKFNREIVQKITRLEDEDKLDAFMQYCLLSEDFLFKASEYEIHTAVLGCFTEFMKEQG